MLSAIDEGGSKGSECEATGNVDPAGRGGSKGVAAYPWISEAFSIIEPILPCTLNDAVAALVERLTHRAVDVAVRCKTKSRYRAAMLAIRHLKISRLRIVDGILLNVSSRRPSIGDTVLKKLMSTGSILESVTGFKPSSLRTYRSILIHLDWISVENTDGQISWVWKGPESAEWAHVAKLNQTGRKKALTTPRES